MAVCQIAAGNDLEVLIAGTLLAGNFAGERHGKRYLQKLSVSIKFWREKGGCLAESTIEKLIQAGIPIRVEGRTNYKTIKKPVRMEYLDDIDIPEFRELQPIS
ncbi:MAG: DUF3440 domain-containing protein [Parabacteroides sp.]